MSLVTIISELWRFFKDNLLRTIMGGLIFALLAVGIRYAINYFTGIENQEAVDYLQQVYNQEPAEFQAVITLEDGDVFQNSYLFDEYFTSPELLQEVETQTGVDLTTWFESEQLLELYKTSQFRGGLAAIRNTSSGVITFRFLVGQSPEENLAVAEVYADLLMSSEIPFMVNQTPAMVHEPMVGELLDLETTPEVATPETLDMYTQTGVITSIIYGLAGFIAGFILMIAFSLFLRLFKERINYAFDYSWDFDDRHLLIFRDRQTEDFDLEALIAVPSVPQRLIVTQRNAQQIQETVTEKPEDAQIYVSRLEAVQTADVVPDEIIIIVYSNQTFKEWYREQYEVAQLYRVPIRIIHIV